MYHCFRPQSPKHKVIWFMLEPDTIASDFILIIAEHFEVRSVKFPDSVQDLSPYRGIVSLKQIYIGNIQTYVVVWKRDNLSRCSM